MSVLYSEENKQKPALSHMRENHTTRCTLAGHTGVPAYSFIRSFTHSFNHSFLFIHSFNHSFNNSIIHSLLVIESFSHPFQQSFIPIESFIHSIIRPFNHSFIQSLIQSSFIHQQWGLSLPSPGPGTEGHDTRVKPVPV